MRESTGSAQGTTKLSTGHGPTRRRFFRSLGTRFGLVTASNDLREFAPDRVPASASIQSRGRCLHDLFLKSIPFLFPSEIYRSVVEEGSGWAFIIRPMAQTNPASSRPRAAAATVDFLRPTSTRCR